MCLCRAEGRAAAGPPLPQSIPHRRSGSELTLERPSGNTGPWGRSWALRPGWGGLGWAARTGSPRGTEAAKQLQVGAEDPHGPMP